ncbi:hypothetical protein [Pectobacterium phage Wc4-1]|uniref:Uncharacterized protein n=1 Tax=Pectobacterium phage Wc4 TaxID=2652428 RepID=A0A5P8D3Z4_9CAUD|nr:hypothetical protein [Pectobacterium phage Wc4]QFP93913.1 hypothetical protein [Pectobacterium phage Wc4-1]
MKMLWEVVIIVVCNLIVLGVLNLDAEFLQIHNIAVNWLILCDISITLLIIFHWFRTSKPNY